METKLSILIALITTILIFPSCSRESISQNYSIPELKNILDNYNQNKLPESFGTYSEASVVMRNATNNRVVVYVVDYKGKTFNSYILHTENNLKDFKAILPKAQILFLHKSLVINAMNRNEKYLLKLTSNDIPIQNEKFDKIFNGFGLAIAYGDPFNSGSVVGESNLRSDSYGEPGGPPVAVSCVCHTTGTGSSCISGGENSSSCSISDSSGQSCSVSCDSDSYSCCTY